MAQSLRSILMRRNAEYDKAKAIPLVQVNLGKMKLEARSSSQSSRTRCNSTKRDKYLINTKASTKSQRLLTAQKKLQGKKLNSTSLKNASSNTATRILTENTFKEEPELSLYLDMESEIIHETSINAVKETIRFPPANFARRQSLKRHSVLKAPVRISTSNNSPVCKNNRLSEYKAPSNNVKCQDELACWLPEYEPIELSNEKHNDYKALSKHMKDIFRKPVYKERKKEFNGNWKNNLLSCVNPLGNIISNFSNHYINTKAKTNPKLVYGFLVGIDVMLKISMKELKRITRTLAPDAVISSNVKKILQIKDYMKLKENPKSICSEINIFNVYP